MLRNPCTCLLLAPLLVLNAAWAQAPNLSPAQANAEKQLDVVVTPKGGAPVAELRQQDFTVLVDKVPQPLGSFQAMGGPSAPVKVVLIIDAVNTSYQTIAYERGEIAKFLKANGGQLAHPTTLAIVTDTNTQVENNFTSDGNALNASFEKYDVALRTLPRSAGFYGATDRTQLSLNALRALTAREASVPGRKLFLWLSPGWPILSGPRIELDSKQQNEIYNNIVDLSTRLRESRITLYSLDPIGVQENLLRVNYYQTFLKGVSKPSQTQLGDLSVQVLAVQSGGLALNSTGISQLLQQCVDDSNAYYELSFTGPRGDKPQEYHSIDVRVDKEGLTARTRASYYSAP